MATKANQKSHAKEDTPLGRLFQHIQIAAN